MKSLKKSPLIFLSLITITLITFQLGYNRPALGEASTIYNPQKNLGRLFFTPEQRAQLDYSQARNIKGTGSSAPVLTVNGIVQKTGGERTVWVNGVSQSAEASGERNPTAQSVTIPGRSRPVKLKVGDKILLDHASSSDQGSSGE